MLYKDRIRFLRSYEAVKQTEIAKYLELDPIVYGHFEREETIMPLKYLIKISSYFNVSLDYLFGFTDILRYDNMQEFKDKITAGLRIKTWRKESKLTQEKLASYLNTNRSLLSNYEKGIYLISTSFLYMICNKYKVSADYLLGIIDTNALKKEI